MHRRPGHPFVLVGGQVLQGLAVTGQISAAAAVTLDVLRLAWFVGTFHSGPDRKRRDLMGKADGRQTGASHEQAQYPYRVCVALELAARETQHLKNPSPVLCSSVSRW